MKITMKHTLLALGIILSPVAWAASGQLVLWDDNASRTAKDDTYTVSSTIGISNPVANVNGYSSGGNWFSRLRVSASSGAANNVAIGTGVASTSEAAAVDLGNYFTFSIKPTDGNTLTLTEVAAKVQGDVGAGLEALTVTAFLRSSVDNYASTIATFTVTTPKNEGTGTATQFGTLTTGTLGVAFSGLTEEVTFRLYAYVQSDAPNWTHIVRFDNIRITGSTATAIPEPATTALLAGAAVMLAVWGMRLRRQQKV
ncbi:PEP-CTERM putative exosortase interaction domain-containing protein [Opitutaceae bacterium TAV1]|nr:PEP-CTERM putative exosortase interaction domain-containing protein [Opitutaceae bacterium TAV1]